MTAKTQLEVLAIAALALWIAAWCTACNPAKKVLKNKDQFEQVGEAWAQQHPCNNDTTIVTARDSVVEFSDYEMDVVRGDNARDTAIVRISTNQPCDPVYYTRTKTISYFDTIKISTRDARVEDVLRQVNNRTRDSLNAAIILSNKYRAQSKSRGWMLVSIASMCIVLLVAGYFIGKYVKRLKNESTALRPLQN